MILGIGARWLTVNLFVLQRRYGDEEKKSGSEGSDDDDYVPYVPVKQRKKEMVRYDRCSSCLMMMSLVML